MSDVVSEEDAQPEEQRPYQSIFGFDLFGEADPAATPDTSQRHDDYNEDESSALEQSPIPRRASAEVTPPDLLEDSDTGEVPDSKEDVNHERWAGGSRKWRHMTRHERRNVVALEKLDADDLARHLYDLHAFKHRACSDPLLTNAQSKKLSRSGKRYWRHNEQWIPSSSWSAWPEEQRRVPWSSERAFLEYNARPGTYHDWNYKGDSSNWRPGWALEQCLRAGIMRDARRALEDSKSDHEGEHSGAAKPSDGTDHVQEAQNIANPSIEGISEATLEKPGSNKSYRSEDCAQDQEPVPLIDDSQTSARVDPLIRRILAQLDHLLCSLHEERNNRHGMIKQEMEGRLSARTSRSSDGSSKERPSSAGLGPSRKRKRSATPALRSVQSDFSEGESSSRNRSARSSAGTEEGLLHGRRYILRDWSHILGHAASLGWKDDAILRAQKRCEALFGEHMEFHKIEFSTLSRTPAMDRKSRRHISATHAGWYCLVEECSTWGKPFEKRRIFKAHLKRVHSMTMEEMAQSDTTLRPAEQTCPHKGCKFRCKLFPARRYAKQHLERVHEGKEAPQHLVTDDCAESPLEDTAWRCDETPLFEQIRSPSPSWLKRK